MEEFKGTKGEWKIEIKELERFCISTENRGLFIDAWGVGIAGIETIEEVEANAKLIAASPELLEALQEMVEVFDREDNTTAEALRIGKAQKAINKALK